MTAFEFQLAEADWKTYDRGDEWVLYDDDFLFDSTPDELDHLETVTGMRMHRVLVEIDEWGAKAIRAATWIGRRNAGIVEPWDTFQPKVMRIRVRRPESKQDGDDAVPPGQPSPPSSTGDEPVTSSSTTDPDSPATTPGSRRRTSAA